MIDSLNTLSIEEKIGQLFFIGISGTTIDVSDDILKRIAPGGVCFFSRNIKDARQIRQLLDDIRVRSQIVPFLSVDQEGGVVDRLRRLITPMPAANILPNATAAGRFGTIVAEILRILGFNMDFAPVVDVITPQRESISNGLFSRAFGRSPEESAEFAGAFIEKLQSGGCLGCVKHFPGLGASEVDSHEDLPKVSISEPELRTNDLLPYQRLFERRLVHSVMIAHAAYPETSLQEWASDGTLLPSSLSAGMINGLLRKELKFDGLVITDDLEMGAIVKNFGVGEACSMAIDAGADMLAICADLERIIEGYDTVVDSVKAGRITEERVDRSLERIAAAKSLLNNPLPFDQQRIAELSDAVARFNDELK